METVKSSGRAEGQYFTTSSWNTYERLLEDHENNSAPRFTYDRGELEIMSPSPEHEAVNRSIALLVGFVAAEMGIDVYDLGSTTFRREDLERGFEPDCLLLHPERRAGSWQGPHRSGRGPATRPGHRDGHHQPLLQQAPHLRSDGRSRGLALRRSKDDDLGSRRLRLRRGY